MIQDDIKNLVVLDSIKESLELLDSDIMPQSETHPIVSGIENVPSQLISTTYGNFSSNFTTFPLSPLEGRVHYIKDSFLHFVFNIRFQIVKPSATSKPNYLYIGPRDTSSIFNQIMLLMDNNTIWNTSFHHIESAIALAAFPASLVDHSPNYATIDKLLANKETPMQLITIPAASGTYSYILKYDLTIDLNRLCVPFSNLEFITSNMGNLRLKVFINNIADAFYYFVLPQSSAPLASNGTSTEFIQYFNTSGLLCLNPVLWNSSSNNISYYVDIPVFTTDTVNQSEAATELSHTTSKIAFIGVPADNVSNPFINTVSADICQTCFDLEEEGWTKLCEYFSSIGKVILPAQQFTTNQFTNGTNGSLINYNATTAATLSANGTFPTPLIGFAGGNNITDVIVTFPMDNHQTCLLHPFATSIQCLLDGKPINSVPYTKISGRAIADFTNACIDTDKDEINSDYLYSLQFPPYIASNGIIEVDDSYLFDQMQTTYETLKRDNGSDGNYIKNPNLCMLVFETGIPDSFHTGACISEFSNRQAMIRLTAQYSTQRDLYDYLANTGSFTSTVTSGHQWFPTVGINYASAYVSVLCDICIVLDYDSSYNTCTSGYVSYAKPYLTEVSQ